MSRIIKWTYAQPLTFLICVVVLSGCISVSKINGKYEFNSWDGKNGYGSTITIKSNKYKQVNWSTNSALEHQISSEGQVIFKGDSIILKPKKIWFYQNMNTGQEFERLEYNCDGNSITNVNNENQLIVLKACFIVTYQLFADALIEKNSEIKFNKK